MITGSIELLDMAIGNLLDDDAVGGLGVEFGPGIINSNVNAPASMLRSHNG